MWERSRFTLEDWCSDGDGERTAWESLDMLAAYDHVSTEALSGWCPRANIVTLQGGADFDDLSYVERDWSGTLRFCMLGELHTRKDPFVAIEAFRELRDDGKLEDAELHLKTSSPGLHPGLQDLIPGLKIYCGIWPESEVRDFYSKMHVILSPSRGEGKNLPVLEMLATGAGAAVTVFGGHEMWFDESFCWSIQHTLAESKFGGMEARADKEHLKSVMLAMYEDREEVARRGKIASEVIPSRCSWRVVVPKYLEMIGVG
jgi:glycosyltransferase involved in cell wall biosynthesis